MKLNLFGAFAWTVAVLVGLLIFPVYSNGETLIGVNGFRALAALGIPMSIGFLPVLCPKARIAAGVAMAIFVIIAGGSVGLFYTPSALMLLWPHHARTGMTSRN